MLDCCFFVLVVLLVLVLEKIDVVRFVAHRIVDENEYDIPTDRSRHAGTDYGRKT